MSVIDSYHDKRDKMYKTIYGIDPSKNDSKEVVEERLDANLTKNTFASKITLYHGSPYKFNVLQPNSLSMGNKMYGPEMAAFLTDTPNNAILWGLQQLLYSDYLIASHAKTNLIAGKIYIVDRQVPTNRGLVSMKDYVKDIFSTIALTIYLYTFKDIPMSKVGAGQLDIAEYTVTEPLRPTNIQELHNNELKKYISFCSIAKFNNLGTTDFGFGNRSLLDKMIYRKDNEKLLLTRQNAYDFDAGKFDLELAKDLLKKEKIN